MSTLSTALSGIALLLVLALAGLWLLGARPRHYELSVEVGRSPDDVFRHLVEPELLKTWLGGLVETRPLTEGGPEVGARSVEVVEERGRRMELTSEIVAYRPPRSMRVRLEGPGVAVTAEYTLTPTDPAGEGTLLRLDQTVRFGGPARLLAPVASATVERKLREDLARLKRTVESGRR